MLTYDVCSVFKFIHEEVFNSRMDEPVPFISQTAAWKIYWAVQACPKHDANSGRLFHKFI